MHGLWNERRSERTRSEVMAFFRLGSRGVFPSESSKVASKEEFMAVWIVMSYIYADNILRC